MTPRFLHIVVVLCLTVTGVAVSADVESGECWPGTPGQDPQDCPPNDPRYPRHWEFRSDLPAEVDVEKMHPAEAALGAIGMSLDTAWQRTIGRDDVVIAVLDSGVRWHTEDLVRKLWLNRGELPLPAGADKYDANDDGVFDILDYTGDARVGDRNGNDLLDPEDLILSFSDCVDDDGNGYPDDISGYDFFGADGRCAALAGADNNAHDDTDFGHGTGIAGSAAAETNNGVGDAGVCPRCRVLPVRVGDSFVVDANRFARGLVFATRSGAKVVASALGSYNNTPAARRAVDFAYENGTALIASAADEYSYHHNFPSTYNHALYVNSIRYNDKGDWRSATTFWGVNPCTNYGARVWVTMPSVSCSSGATSRLAGVAGLVVSAALDGKTGPLHPEELFQLLRATADDLDNRVPDWSEALWPATPGFDEFYGYGRVHARRAVEAAFSGDVPPRVDLLDPDWFELVSPRQAPRLTVRGSIAAPRADEVTWALEYALGVQPSEDQYVRIAGGTEDSVGRRGVLGVLDFGELPLPSGPAPTNRDDRDRYSVTLRLRAIDDRGRVAEARRSFFVLDDPTWQDGFPLRLEASGEAAPLLVDLDGDGRDEIVLPTADGFLRIVEVEASGVRTHRAALDRAAHVDPLTGYRETVVRGAAVGALGENSSASIVVASHDGRVYAFDSLGNRRRGFPVAIDTARAAATSEKRVVESGFLSRPVLADLDGRPGLEIVASAMDGHIYAWRGDGTPLPGFPVKLADSRLISTPAIGDLDGDGTPEIVVGSNQLNNGRASAWAVRASGTGDPRGALLPGWDPLQLPGLRPDLLPTLGTGVSMEPALVDVDADGDVEAVLYAVTGSTIRLVDQTDSGPRTVAEFSMTPDTGSGLGGMTFLGGTGSPIVADTDDDGVPELYAPLLSMRMLTLRTRPGVPLDVPVALGGWPLSGQPSDRRVPMLPGWPRRMEDMMILAKPAAIDVDGDGHREVLMGSGGYLLHAFRPAGGEADGFPKFTGGWIFSAPAQGDLDGDGRPELVSVTREGWLFAWKLGQPPQPSPPEQQAARSR